MQSKNNFYKHFINDVKCTSEDDRKQIDKYKGIVFMIIILLGISGMIGYRFAFGFWIGIAKDATILCSALFIIASLLLIKLYKLDKKYKTYKKRINIFLLLLPFYLLTIIQCVLGNLLAKIYLNENGSKLLLGADPLYWWVIIFPFYIGYLVFYYYAHINGIKKINENNLIQDSSNNSTDNEIKENNDQSNNTIE